MIVTGNLQCHVLLRGQGPGSVVLPLYARLRVQQSSCTVGCYGDDIITDGLISICPAHTDLLNRLMSQDSRLLSRSQIEYANGSTRECPYVSLRTLYSDVW